MEEKLQTLNNDIKKVADSIKITDKKSELKKLENKSQSVDFWQNPIKAKETLRNIDQLQKTINVWDLLIKESDELLQLSELSDPTYEKEIENKYQQLKRKYQKNRIYALLNKEHDEKNAILAIHSGTGGIDAQDFAMMLERMYLRYFERKEFAVNVIERSIGTEAGIKKVVFEVKGLFAYGYLKGEAGIHRLIRLSPYNAANLRQTSFALVEVIPEIQEEKEIEINEKEIRIDTFRAQGHGGQSVNTTDSAVRITHLPTKTVVTCQNERSQLQNKETALRVLKSRLLEIKKKEASQEKAKLKGESQEASFGNQIRSYVLHPYKLVKDHRTKHEEKNVEAVLDGKLDEFIKNYLEK